ncbi:hypothetical protein QPK87_37945 [Kamptonema cortianum]|nr:hypothetical protein [Geitlerinema splendidum]MDK3162291.1 hypothetical protein [Kamptonema cortianum]
MLEFFGLVGKIFAVGVSALWSGQAGNEIAKLVPTPEPKPLQQIIRPQRVFGPEYQAKPQIVHFHVDSSSPESTEQAAEAISKAKATNNGGRKVIFVIHQKA